MRKTKIVCTIGPATASKEKIRALIERGMNVARLNFSHGTHADHAQVVQWIYQLQEELSSPIAIMLDTKGPEIRLSTFSPSGQKVSFQKGEQLTLVPEGEENLEAGLLPISPGEVLSFLEVGMEILFQDGFLTSHVVWREENRVCIQMHQSGELSSGRGVNIPQITIPLPALTRKDREDLIFGCTLGVHFVAASFVRSARHLLQIRQLLIEQKRPDISLLAKIENREGVEQFEEILQVADGILIARGDLGVELPLEEVPHLQKEMISRCSLAGKLSITATQMLESMMYQSRPTRAEVSDVANAIYDRTSAVMLSGETAQGNYPLESLETMVRIISKAEETICHLRNFSREKEKTEVMRGVARSAVEMAHRLQAQAIFVFTREGRIAQILSSFFPSVPLLSLTSDPHTYHKLSLLWGVTPLLHPSIEGFEEAFCTISHYALAHRLLSRGDLIVIMAGTLFSLPGMTHTLVVRRVGQVIAKGFQAVGKNFSGQIIYRKGLEKEKGTPLKESILLVEHWEKEDFALFCQARGVILELSSHSPSVNRELMEAAESYGFSLLITCEHLSFLLCQGRGVMVDTEKQFIYLQDKEGDLMNGKEKNP